MQPDVPIGQFKLIFRRAFDKFFDALTGNPYLGDFLKNADLQRLKEQQQLNFLDAVQEGGERFFAHYRGLAAMHYDNGLPYVEYRASFSLLQTLLLEESNALGCGRAMREAIYAYIRSAKNASAAGYLERMLQKDEKTLNRQLSQQLDIPVVKEHLYWVLHIIEDIRTLNGFPDIAFDHRQCEFGRWFAGDDAQKYISDPSVRETIETTHRDIHLTTQNIYRSIQQQDYHKIFIDYIILVRQSMYLYSELNLNVTQQELIEKGTKDVLTGLLNRRNLEQVLESEIHLHALTERTFCVVMFDLDHFKSVNDTFGHQAGDAVLVTFSGLLRQMTRTTDALFRYGGEEFFAILPGTTPGDACKLAEKIRTAFAAHRFEGRLAELRSSVSIGITHYAPELQDDSAQLILRADLKLYRAKQLGRNRTEC